MTNACCSYLVRGNGPSLHFLARHFFEEWKCSFFLLPLFFGWACRGLVEGGGCPQYQPMAGTWEGPGQLQWGACACPLRECEEKRFAGERAADFLQSHWLACNKTEIGALPTITMLQSGKNQSRWTKFWSCLKIGSAFSDHCQVLTAIQAPKNLGSLFCRIAKLWNIRL